jgi:DNA-binding NtrC family response regulator
MNSPAFADSPPSGLSALVVEPEIAPRLLLFSMLTSAGLNVTATDSFNCAQALLVAAPPALLVTEIRLGVHSGLHLTILARLRRPDMTVIVTSRFHDRFLRRGAEALGASFVRKPLTTGKLLAVLSQPTLECPHSQRRQMTGASHDKQERRYRKRRRDIATFLLLEASRR